jgi:hypothetical protein
MCKAPGYSDIVKNPIDLTTISERLREQSRVNSDFVYYRTKHMLRADLLRMVREHVAAVIASGSGSGCEMLFSLSCLVCGDEAVATYFHHVSRLNAVNAHRTLNNLMC